ncbi:MULTISPECIES: preprotein translocase subunit SecE [Nitrincola]|uniref:Protein translocase subunit SecE n=2 Tax=Nitrincola TaxID=267849 RepID=A0A364NHH1_9GAMM|nr:MULTISPECIES: preprotein translocase subunit SecE [Nitrincola]EXJ09099.1 Preprotein translocase subunit SecE [Nitrincola nitratireducens]RAU16480.1 preprotein translocase subunit SecE [Nitrincola tibetensis]
MNTKVNSEGSKLDSIKWAVVVLIIAVGVVGNSIFSDESLLYRVLALIVLAGVAGFVALQTAKGQLWFKLFKDAKGEMRRVVWPTRQETLQTTLMVLAAVLVVALMLWGLDSLLGWIVSGAIG